MSATLASINEMYCDVLKEIGNIGAGNATTALAGMLGQKIDMAVPVVKFMDITDMGSALGNEDDVVVGIFLNVEHDVNGSMMFITDEDSAHRIANALMMRPKDYKEPFDEMDISAIKEVGNIVAASYLNALSTLTNMIIQPSVPNIAIDMAASILSVPATMFGTMGDQALMIQTKLLDEYEITGNFVLMPDEESYEKILRALGIPV